MSFYICWASVPNVGIVLYLVIGKNWAIFADIIFAEHAMAAFAETAAHILFHRQIYLLRLKSKFQQLHGSEFHHNRRTTDYRHSVRNIHIIALEDGSYHANVAVPTAVCFVNGKFDQASSEWTFKKVPITGIF